MFFIPSWVFYLPIPKSSISHPVASCHRHMANARIDSIKHSPIESRSTKGDAVRFPHHHNQKISTCDLACFHGSCRSDRPKPPDRRSPALRRIASGCKPNTPVKVVFFVCPLPISYYRSTFRFVCLATSLSFLLLLACSLQPLPTASRTRF